MHSYPNKFLDVVPIENTFGFHFRFRKHFSKHKTQIKKKKKKTFSKLSPLSYMNVFKIHTFFKNK
jgi:hypothetical protein